MNFKPAEQPPAPHVITTDDVKNLQVAAVSIAAARSAQDGITYAVTRAQGYLASNKHASPIDVGYNTFGFSIFRKDDGLDVFVDANGDMRQGRHIVTFAFTVGTDSCWLYVGPNADFCNDDIQEYTSVVARLAEFIYRSNELSLPLGERLKAVIRHAFGFW